MSQDVSLLLKNGTLMLPSGACQTDLFLQNGRIQHIGPSTQKVSRTVDCTGLVILPGAIDTQVHFREPGAEAKEDFYEGSRAAIKGGITGIFEMPNTNPPTTTKEALKGKLERAHGRMWCHYAFYMGATAENAENCGELEKLPGTAGIKIFMGASTGSLLVSKDETLEKILRCGSRRIAIHAEDEDRLQDRLDKRMSGDPSSHPLWRDKQAAIEATKRILRLARKTGRRVHILHISTADELPLLAENRDVASCEFTPQHLTLCAEDCYERLGNFAQMNPPIRDRQHRDTLWEWVKEGFPDVVGSDHAPHLKEEKAKAYPHSPSGMPGVQTLMPLMLHHVAQGRLSLQRLCDLTSLSPARLFGLVRKGRIAVGYDADLTIIDPNRRWEMDSKWLAYKCGWSPFEGMKITGKVQGTVINGNIVMWDDEILGQPTGKPFCFEATDRPQNRKLLQEL